MEWSFSEDWYEANVRDYTKLMERYGKDHRMGEMEKLFGRMRAAGLPADVISYSVFMNAYARVRQFGRVREVLEEMEAEGVKADDRAYGALLVGYGNAGRPEDAEKVLEVR